MIPNQKLLSISHEKTSLLDMFRKADEVLLQAVKGISDLINIRGLINLDFADIRTVMSTQGMAIMGTGSATGENRAVEAATAAISSPLLENISIDGATGIIINVTGGRDLSLHEVNEASTLITEAAHEDAEIIFGAVIDESLGDEVRVTVIATGFGVDQVKLGVPQHYSYQAQPHQQQGYLAQAQQQAQYYQQQQQQQYQAAPIPQAPVMAQPLPPIPPLQQPAYTVPSVVAAPVAAPVATPVAPMAAPVMVEEVSAAPTAQEMIDATANSRDMLIAKAKAYREQALKQRELPTEQLSMEMSLDHANAAKSAVDLSSPFDQSNLDVPTYLRRRQRNEESQDGM